jgi:hypothetical protein
VTVVAFILFFLAGLAFGFAAPGKWKWIPLLFPIFLFIGAFLFNGGVDSTAVIRFIVALIVMVVGILIGIVLDSREDRGTAAQTG